MGPVFSSLTRKLVVLFISSIAISAYAQAEEDAILVLDASGSMWGQIEGTAKIEIARDVIGQLLQDLPANRRLGLVAYGHNRKGDCTDIEEIAALGASRSEISTAVSNLKPKGKTPLSASVKYAAEKLRYTEVKATVILISDGEETCNLDPCEMGTALEQDGIDFTAHVIGFDIANEQHRAQLQCLAENTGGKYLNASNAAELTSALTETVVNIPEPSVTTGISMRATELSGGPLVESGLTWKVSKAGGGETVFEADNIGAAETDLPPSAYDIEVVRPSDGLKGETKNFEVRLGSHKTVTIPLEISFDVSLRSVPEDAAPVSSEIVVTWIGPNRTNDYITITAPDASDTVYTDYEYTRDGSPSVIRMPPDVGDYEIRYVLGHPARVLARKAIKATPVEIALAAADTIAAGAEFPVTWIGPGYQDDWITIVKPEAGKTEYMSYEYTRNGNPVMLTAPVDAGQYELRYVLAGERVATRRPVTVTDVTSSISGPASAVIGTRIKVDWSGPSGNDDWITVTSPNAADSTYTDYAYTRNGSPVIIRMPLEPGTYELRYVQNSEKVIARQTIDIVAANASLDAEDVADVGSTLSIAWTGPGEDRDYITVTDPGAGETAYNDYKYTRNGSPVEIKMPVEPGIYELRYVLDSGKVIVRRPILLVDVDASVSGPSRVAAGSVFEMSWQGPGYYRDYVTIVEKDAADTQYNDYTYTRTGNSTSLKAPAIPGRYELRYVLDSKRVIARTDIEVTAAE